MRLGEFVASWPEAAPALGARTPETIRHTAEMVQGFERRFGRQELGVLSAVECASWAARNGPQVRYVRTVLNDAVKLGLLERSPLEGVRGRGGVQRGEYVPEWGEVLELAGAGERWGIGGLVLAAADSGMRVGEIARVVRDDVVVGPSPGTLLANVVGKGEKPRTVVVLEAGARAMMETGVEVGLLFRTPRGFRWDRKSVSRVFVKARRVAGLPESCTFHSLRKHHATKLLNMGNSDLDVAVQLGHFDAAGRPDADLVRRVYGRPDHGLALERIARAA